MHKRFVEIDMLRTCAILGMVVYHIIFILWYQYGWDVNLQTGFWPVLQKVTAHSFLLLVGISFSLSWHRRPSIERTIKRGMIVLGCGMLITVVTMILIPQHAIVFGILHCIGLSIMLLPFFGPPLEQKSIIVGAVLYITGRVLNLFYVPTAHFLAFGLRPDTFTTLDYFPLLPWFGIVLIGYGMGYSLYVQPAIKPRPTSKLFHMLSFPGRHALIIYMIHVPIILGVLYALV